MAHNLNHMTWLHPTHDLQVMHLVKAVSHGFHPRQETHPTKVATTATQSIKLVTEKATRKPTRLLGSIDLPSEDLEILGG